MKKSTRIIQRATNICVKFVCYKDKFNYSCVRIILTFVMSSCAKCNGTFEKPKAEFMKCSGFCGKSFHVIDCSELTKPGNGNVDRSALDAVKNYENILFMCPGCRTCLKNVSFVTLATKVESVFGKLDDIKSSLMNELTVALSSLKDGVDENVSVLATKISQLPVRGPSSFSDALSSMSPPVTQHAAEIIGTGGIDDQLKSVSVKKRRFVYVSRFENSVTKEQVIKHVVKKLNIPENDVICRSLVKLNVDASTLRFISFKIGVFEDDFDKVMNAEIWPNEVLIREFISNTVDQSKKSEFRGVNLG